MRQIILFIIFLLMKSSISGQNFKSVFGVDTAQWNYVTDYPGADYIATAVFKAYDDTVINSYIYKKLYEDYLWGYNLYGYLKEDTVNGKLWIRFNNDTADYLLMDLKLNLGDTFMLKNRQTAEWDEKFVVKNNTTENGIHLIYLEGTKNFDKIEFMEGIGVSYIFEVFNEPWIYYDLLCSYKDNIIKYDNPDQENCYIPFTGLGILNTQKNNVQIFPNPFNNKLNIIIDQGFLPINTFELYNIQGQKLIYQRFSTKVFDLSLSLLDKGIYFIKINGTYIKKVIKNGY